MTRVLFVDDEEHILSGLRRAIGMKRRDWDMHFASSGREALAMLEEMGGADVVVSDMRMPEMNGNDLLERVAERWPLASRLILSGYAEHESAVRAAGVAHQFIAKPCNAGVLELAVARTCSMRDRLSDPTLLGAINGLGSLPALPAAYNSLIAELNNLEPSLGRIASVINSDVAMAAKVLQLVNSSYFGLPRHIESVEQAAMLLGLETLRDLAISTSVFRALEGVVDVHQLEAINRRGRHVARVVSALLADRDVDKISASELRIAGLIHGVGIILMLALRPNLCRGVTALEGDWCALMTIGQDALGVDPAVIGAYMLGVWGLPEGTVQAVYFQNTAAIDTSERNEASWYLGFACELLSAVTAARDPGDTWIENAAAFDIDVAVALELTSCAITQLNTETGTNA